MSSSTRGMPVLHLAVERFGRMKRLLHVFVNSCITAADLSELGNQQPFIIKEDSSNLEIFWVLKEKWDIAFQQINTLQKN